MHSAYRLCLNFSITDRDSYSRHRWLRVVALPPDESRERISAQPPAGLRLLPVRAIGDVQLHLQDRGGRAVADLTPQDGDLIARTI